MESIQSDLLKKNRISEISSDRKSITYRMMESIQSDNEKRH